MKISGLLSFAALAHAASAHYIFSSLIAGDTNHTGAVRQPISYFPLKSVSANNITCNHNTPANQTVSVAAGSTVGFHLYNSTIFHEGPAAIYLGSAPTTAASWDGSGANWFKIAEWGATFNPFGFTDFNAAQLMTTIPAATPSGEYLIRVEQVGLHLIDSPEWYVSCAQIKVTGGGSGTPTKVSIPGYYTATDPGIAINIYTPVPTAYTVPGPRPWTG